MTETLSIGAISTQPPSLNNVDTVINIVQSAECPICLSEYPSPEILPVCNQKHSFCKSCINYYLERQISEFRADLIRCPQDQCTEILEEKFIREILSETQYQVYQTQLQKKRDKGKSYCPNSKCSKQYIPKKKSNKTTCECGTQICNKCGNTWHKGKTCAQAIRLELKEFSKENKVRFCLNCKIIVIRDYGCSHMTCSRCYYQWCWLCEKKYTRNHEFFCGRMVRPRPLQTKKISDVFCFICFIIANGLYYLFMLLFVLLVVGLILSPVAFIITIIIVAVRN